MATESFYKAVIVFSMNVWGKKLGKREEKTSCFISYFLFQVLSS